MDKKPASMSMKDWLVRRLAPKLLISERTIDAVISHQFNSANKASHKNNSIEIAGFGRFLFNKGKALKRIEYLKRKSESLSQKLANEELTEKMRNRYEVTIASISEQIAAIELKLIDNESVTDIRGMEEQVDSPSTFEETNRLGEQNKDGDM